MSKHFDLKNRPLSNKQKNHFQTWHDCVTGILPGFPFLVTIKCSINNNAKGKLFIKNEGIYRRNLNDIFWQSQMPIMIRRGCIYLNKW